MDTVLTDYSISISEFKKNPAIVVREAADRPVAVLSHNKPSFYMVSPKVYARMLSEHADRRLVAVVKDRLKRKHTAVEVDFDTL